jgi:hypothetical protein
MSGGILLRLRLVWALFCGILGAVIIVMQATYAGAASEQCSSKPDSSAPPGSHWYYRIDRVNQRRCWYLSSGDSRIRQASSLRRRELINRGAAHEVAQRSEIEGEIVRGSIPRREPITIFDEQTRSESVGAKVSPSASEGLVPRTVVSVSYIEPRAAEESLRRGTNHSLFFLCGALATALMIAGGAFQIVGRLHRRPKMAWLKSRRQPPMKIMGSKNKALSSKKVEIKSKKLDELRKYLVRSNISSPRLGEAISRSRLPSLIAGE